MPELVVAQVGSLAITNYHVILMGLGLVFGLYMAWSIGANDVANAMGTSVGSGALTLKQALIVAAVLEFSGAFLVGQHVTGAIRKDIIPYEAFEAAPDNYVFGMLAALLAAAAWLQLATYFGLPVSTTHTIVGAIIGFGLVALSDWSLIGWGKVGGIVSSWVVSPLLAGSLSFIIFTIIQRCIFYQKDLIGACRRTAPFFVFAVFLTIVLVTLWKGLKPLKLDFTFGEALLLGGGVSTIAALISMRLVKRIELGEGEGNDPETQSPIIGEELERMSARLRKLSTIASGTAEANLKDLRDQVGKLQTQVTENHGPPGPTWGTPEMRAVERIFVFLQILSACAVAFAHGANDVANAVGPLSGVVSALLQGGVSATTQLSQGWGMGILAIGGVGIVVGLATWGRRVIETIGKRITELTPTRGFSAEFGAAITILVASRFKLPISTTHTLVGAVLGVGIARGVGALNIRVIRDIVVSWVITLPAGALLAIVFYYVLKLVFGG